MKMNAVSRAQLTFQMLTLVKKYHGILHMSAWINVGYVRHDVIRAQYM